MKATQPLLDTLAQHGIADAAQCKRLAEAPGIAVWISVLQALAAWISALCVVGSLLVLTHDAEWLFGILLIAAGLALFWHTRDAHAAASTAAFQRQLALALSLSGQAVLIFSVEYHMRGSTGLAFSALLASVLSIPPSGTQHRTACLLLALWCVYENVALAGLGLLGLTLSAVAVVLWLARGHWVVWAHAGYLTALTHSVTLAGLAVLFSWHQNAPIGGGLFWRTGRVDVPGWFYLYPAGALLLWLACAVWLSRLCTARERGWMVGTALLIAVLGSGAPGLLVCLALMLATFHTCARGWCSVTLIGAAGFLGLYYYSLDQTLLVKSATLAAVGALLLVLGRVVQHWRAVPGSAP